jgi:hypothetical protein
MYVHYQLNLTFPIISAMTGMAEFGNTDYMTETSVVAASKTFPETPGMTGVGRTR